MFSEKQPPQVFYRVIRYSTRLRPATLLKKRLWRRCIPMNFTKFLKALFLTEHLRTTASNIVFPLVWRAVFIWPEYVNKRLLRKINHYVYIVTHFFFFFFFLYSKWRIRILNYSIEVFIAFILAILRDLFSSHLGVFYWKAVLKFFSKFTRKHLCWSLQ